MNNKGQVGLGVLIMVAVTVIVGAILLVNSAQNVGTTTALVTATNVTIGGTNATVISIPGKSWTGLVIYNHSNNVIVPATNYTLTNNAVVNGAETATLLFDDPDGRYTGFNMNASGTYQPVTYITSSGGRSLANLIPVFFALLIGVVALIPTLRSKLTEFMR